MIKPPSQALNRSASELTMLPQYQGLSKLKAIEKFFENNPGKVVSITEVIEALYGQITSIQRMMVRDTIGKTLSLGKKRGLWKNVPRRLGFYQGK